MTSGKPSPLTSVAQAPWSRRSRAHNDAATVTYWTYPSPRSCSIIVESAGEAVLGAEFGERVPQLSTVLNSRVAAKSR